jgi:hypothetical protein
VAGELAGFPELRTNEASHEFRESTPIISEISLLHSWLDFWSLLAGRGKSAAGLAAVVNRAFHLITTLVNFSRVVDCSP